MGNIACWDPPDKLISSPAAHPSGGGAVDATGVPSDALAAGVAASSECCEAGRMPAPLVNGEVAARPAATSAAVPVLGGDGGTGGPSVAACNHTHQHYVLQHACQLGARQLAKASVASSTATSALRCMR